MRALVLLGMLAGCGDTATDGPTDTDETKGDIDPFAQFVNTTDPLTTESGAAADLACYTPGEDFAKTVWQTATVDSSKQVDQALDILVQDFETDDPVDDALVEVWFNDTVSGAPDFNGDSDENGELTAGTFPVCQPVSVRVSTDPVLDESKVSISAHLVADHDAGGTSSDEFTSVSKVTFQLIPSILGITPDPARSIVAGTAYDCARGQKLENAQIIVYDESGAVADPDVVRVKYFEEEFPARDRTATSKDGLWVAVNVPPGNIRVEMWGNVDGSLQLLGATQLQSYADSINLGNITAGIGDGVFFPESCEADAR